MFSLAILLFTIFTSFFCIEHHQSGNEYFKQRTVIQGKKIIEYLLQTLCEI